MALEKLEKQTPIANGQEREGAAITEVGCVG